MRGQRAALRGALIVTLLGLTVLDLAVLAAADTTTISALALWTTALAILTWRFICPPRPAGSPDRSDPSEEDTTR